MLNLIFKFSPVSAIAFLSRFRQSTYFKHMSDTTKNILFKTTYWGYFLLWCRLIVIHISPRTSHTQEPSIDLNPSFGALTLVISFAVFETIIANYFSCTFWSCNIICLTLNCPLRFH